MFDVNRGCVSELCAVTLTPPLRQMTNVYFTAVEPKFVSIHVLLGILPSAACVTPSALPSEPCLRSQGDDDDEFSFSIFVLKLCARSCPAMLNGYKLVFRCVLSHYPTFGFVARKSLIHLDGISLQQCIVSICFADVSKEVREAWRASRKPALIKYCRGFFNCKNFMVTRFLTRAAVTSTRGAAQYVTSGHRPACLYLRSLLQSRFLFSF